jgi:hypothetical protein
VAAFAHFGRLQAAVLAAHEGFCPFWSGGLPALVCGPSPVPQRDVLSRGVRAFAARVLTFAAIICAPDATFEVKETEGSGLGLFAVQVIVLSPLQPLPGLTGWRRSLGDAEPMQSLNSWISNSAASNTAHALIGSLSLGNHRCESDLEWCRSSAAAAGGAVSVRAKAGKTARFAAGAEIRWSYGGTFTRAASANGCPTRICCSQQSTTVVMSCQLLHPSVRARACRVSGEGALLGSTSLHVSAATTFRSLLWRSSGKKPCVVP